jgi:hypothetical protein
LWYFAVGGGFVGHGCTFDWFSMWSQFFFFALSQKMILDMKKVLKENKTDSRQDKGDLTVKKGDFVRLSLEIQGKSNLRNVQPLISFFTGIRKRESKQSVNIL